MTKIIRVFPRRVPFQNEGRAMASYCVGCNREAPCVSAAGLAEAKWTLELAGWLCPQCRHPEETPHKFSKAEGRRLYRVRINGRLRWVSIPESES